MKGFKFIIRAVFLAGTIYILGLIVGEFNQEWGIYDATKVEISANDGLSPARTRIFAARMNGTDDTQPPFVLEQALYDSVVTWNFPFKDGENDFVVLYDDKWYFTFNQYKYDLKNQCQYHIRLWKNDSLIDVEVDISGSGYDFFSGTMEPVTWPLFPDTLPQPTPTDSLNSPT